MKKLVESGVLIVPVAFAIVYGTFIIVSSFLDTFSKWFDGNHLYLLVFVGVVALMVAAVLFVLSKGTE